MKTDAMPIPPLGLRTYRLQGRQLVDFVRDGLDLGYRHIDTAQSYGNEAQIGQAIAASGVARDELFLTTKIGAHLLTQTGGVDSIRSSLKALKTDRVDLTLLHGPLYDRTVSVAQAMAALLKARQQGLTRWIGVANLTLDQLRQAVAAVGATAIATHQVEFDPWTNAAPVLAFARRHGIQLTAYQPLFSHRSRQEPAIDEIARRHGATPAQVVLAWLLHQGCIVLPSATGRENLVRHLWALSLRLSAQELRAIDCLAESEPAPCADLAPAWG